MSHRRAQIAMTAEEPPVFLALERDRRCTLQVEAGAAKRVGLRFVARRTASWDRRQLAGTY